MKKTLLIGSSALALVLGLSAGAWAQDVSVASRGGGDIIDDVIGDDSFRNTNVVSTNVLAQVVVAQADSDEIVQSHDGYEGKIELDDNVFDHTMGVFNVGLNTGVNVAQAGQIGIAASANFNVTP